MSYTDNESKITLKITKFPEHLLLPKIDNNIMIQVINDKDASQKINFVFQGENLDVILPDDFENTIEFEPKADKYVKLNLNPTNNGFGKLTIYINYMKSVQYTQKVQKVRQTIANSQIKKIFKKFDLKLSEKYTPFNKYEYFVDLPGKKLNKSIKEFNAKEKSYKSQEGQVTLADIEKDIRFLAKGYLHNKNLNIALELANRLSNKNKMDFYVNLIRAFSSIDLQKSLEATNAISNNEEKIKLFRNIALDKVDENPEHASKIAIVIKDPSIKENLVRDVILKTIEKKVESAIPLLSLIEKSSLQINLLFQAIKKLYETKKTSQIPELLNNVINLLINSTQIDLSENNFNNQGINLLLDALNLLAEISSPTAVDSIIKSINKPNLKETVEKSVFNNVYEMVDELIVKNEPTVALSQYFLFNTYTKINDKLRDFSLLGGNVSNNILSDDFNYNIAFISLFSFNFSIFPVLDRLYSDIKINLKKSFTYYIFPSIDNLSEDEFTVIDSTIKEFFKFKNQTNEVNILNLDFIPYLGIPTIITSGKNNLLLTRLSKVFGDSVNIINDNDTFQGGESMDILMKIFPSGKYQIINLILSYEFIYDYDMFKKFVQAIV